jgi:tRNA (cmo5U34)-methyltransferase
MNNAEYLQMLEYLQIARQSKYSYQDIKARFEAEPAAVYGANMANWIPDFAYTHQLLLESSAIHLPPRAIGVELGAGSGRVSKLLLETFADLRVTLVDLSPNMLNEAKKQLAAYAGQCAFLVGDMFDPRLDFPVESLDYVLSVFAICHAQGIGIYEQLYRRIHAWLKPGGYFVCYDHVLGDTDSLTALNALGWHRRLATHQTAAQAKDGIVSTYQEDSPLSLRQHLSLLSGLGFSAVDVLYKRDIFGMYAAVK